MFSFLKLMLAGSLAMFAAYVFYVEPNASRDPVAAVSRAAQRLATTCERNQAECQLRKRRRQQHRAMPAGVGWAVLTGKGRLVYVPNPENARHADDRHWSDCANPVRLARRRPPPCCRGTIRVKRDDPADAGNYYSPAW